MPHRGCKNFSTPFVLPDPGDRIILKTCFVGIDSLSHQQLSETQRNPLQRAFYTPSRRPGHHDEDEQMLGELFVSHKPLSTNYQPTLARHYFKNRKQLDSCLHSRIKTMTEIIKTCPSATPQTHLTYSIRQSLAPLPRQKQGRQRHINCLHKNRRKQNNIPPS